MAAGVTILHKRKVGAFVGGELAAGEFGVDTFNSDIYFSVDGTTVVQIDPSGTGTVTTTGTTTDGQIAVFTGQDDIESTANLAFDGTDLTVGTNKVLDAGDTSAVGQGWFIDEDTMSSDDATKVPSQQSVKAYVDSAVVGLLDYKGAYDANANSPDLDTSPSGILKGDTYTVTVAGTFYTTVVEVGDVLIAEVDNAGTSSPPESDWTIVQRNEDGVALTADGLDQFAATTSAELAGVISDETGSAGGGLLVFSNSPTLTTPDLGTPSAATLTNATGLPVSTGISGLGAEVATFLATPSSANLITAVTGETGNGALVFGTSPTIATPSLTLETGTAPTAEGRIQWNSTTDELLIGDGATTKTFVAEADLSITESQISNLQAYLLEADINTYEELNDIVADVELSHSSLTENLTNKTMDSATCTIDGGTI